MKLRQTLQLVQVVNVVSFLAVLVVNALANILPINGMTTGEVAQMYPNLFTPAGFTFAIWGLIYFALGWFVLYQAGLLPGISPDLSVVRSIGWLFAVSSIANVAWILAWHYLLVPLSLAMMVLLLVSLIAIYVRLRGRESAGRAETWLVRVPFSLYLGWISVATIANITVTLVRHNWDAFGLSAALWTVVVIVLADILALYLLLTRDDRWYAAVTVWALLGIYVQHVTTFSRMFPSVITTTLVSMGVIGIGIVVTLIRRVIRGC